MAWNGSGSFQRTNGSFSGASVWEDDANAGFDIVDSRHDNHDQDLAQGIDNCLTKDGQNSPTADLSMNTFKHTNVGDGTARNHYATVGQLQDQTVQAVSAVGGTANAITATMSPAISAYVTGARYTFKAGASANSGATTLKISNGPITAVQYQGSALSGGEIGANTWHTVVYDGSVFQLLNPAMSGSTRTVPATVGQVQDGNFIWGGTSGGTSTAYTLTLSPAIAAYAAGQRFLFIANASNTGAATLNVNGVGAKNIFLRSTNAAAPTGYIRTNQLCEVVYDGTQFQLSESAAELQSNAATYLGQSSGTANALVLTPSPAITNSSYTGLLGFYNFYKDAAANTGACTINISGLGAINLVDRHGAALKAGMLQASLMYQMFLNGNVAYLINPSSVWQSYTPTLTQSATVTFTTNDSQYKLLDNNTVVWQFNLTATSAGTASNAIQLTLPLTAAASNAYSCVGAALILKNSGALIYSSVAALSSTTAMRFFSGSGTSANYVGITPAITLASGDQIAGTITYRI
ncbi:MAG: hypothetical protein EB060_09525 [Proteobacteria bacterium]|nr:hypothetical protein [Pseudomonadota bacterium]